MQKELILILAVVLAACSSPITHKPSQVAPIAVQMQVVGGQTATFVSHYVGAVEAVHATPLSMQTGGRVLEIRCKNGERVRKGQLLARVDNTQALNALRSAEAALRQAQDGYDRVKQVHSQGAVTDQQMVEIESRLAQAKALCDAARKQVNECDLTAPCEGLVSGLDLQVGQMLVPGLRVLSILDVSAFSVRFTVPETEISQLTLGQKGQVECPAADTTLVCTVSDKGLEANRLSHTYEVTADIHGGRDILRPGMVCKVLITHYPSQGTNEIIIPAHCVHLMKQGPSVWVARDGHAERLLIQTGGYQADGVVATGGLQCGDTLITDGYQKLYQGCALTIE